MKHYSAIAIFAILFFTSFGANANELHYSVDLRDCRLHLVHILLKPEGFVGKRAAIFEMPVWAPGAYSVSHYGHYVVNFRALDKHGKPLPVTQINDDRWNIPNARALATIEYDVLDSHKDSTSLYFAMANMDTSLFFANATALFGYFDDDKTAPATITYEKRADWKLDCALPPSKSGYLQDTNSTFQNTNFYAKNYDVLADAPVIASPTLTTRSFREGNAIYDLVVASDDPFDDPKMDSLSLYLRKVVYAETDFFHDTPFDHYSFILYAPTPTHLPSFAEGALEHANSSDYMLVNLDWTLFKRVYLSIFSHEFFHLWNVKRIHSSLLGPFDYTQRVMTTSLWMAEGITEYYAHTLLSRYEIEPPENFYNDIEQWAAEYAHATAAQKSESLEQLSIDESDFHLDNAELFYIKGPLVGWMLDLEIRNKTNNKKSLDDVMLALNADAKRGKTFAEDNLIHVVEQYAGVDLTDFYDRYIHGTDSLPIDRYLAFMGLRKGGKSEGKASLGLTSDGRLFLQSLDTNTAFARAGMKPGDALIAINGTKLS
ncbi:MAG TPA: hypothetical protein VG537_04440, partial [Candidatus Kapabacteria bacterium]|nr:hypothetical protein [Candidatus Kapabacteria bacterium]